MNGVDGVVLVVIQISGDPSAERTAPPRSTHVRDGRRLLLLDPARGKERLRKTAPPAARRRGGGSSGIPIGLRQAHNGGGEVLGRGGLRLEGWYGCPPLTPLFIGEGKRGPAP